MDIKMISNSDGNHLDELKNLFQSPSDRLIIISPFLAKNIQELLSEFSFKKTKKVELITTFKPLDPEQLSKPRVLRDFFDNFKNNYPHIKIKIHIDNQLHGKIYIAMNGKKRSLILGSANFTRNGLLNNHEWSLQIDNDNVIDNIIEDTFNSIEYPDVTYHQVCKACQFAEIYERDHPEWTKKPRITCDILKPIYSVENEKNTNPQYFLKPIGHSESPLLLEEQRDFSDLHQNLHFSKKKPKGVRKGDIIITTAVGAGSILSYFIVTGGLHHVTKEEIDEDPWKERWPWYMEGRNQSTEFGKEWWKFNIRRQDALNDYLSKCPNIPVTYAGGFTLGTINRGNDKVKITKEFGEFLISKIKNSITETKHNHANSEATLPDLREAILEEYDNRRALVIAVMNWSMKNAKIIFVNDLIIRIEDDFPQRDKHQNHRSSILTIVNYDYKDSNIERNPEENKLVYFRVKNM